MSNGNHSAEDTCNTLLDAQLMRSQVNADDTVPKNDSLRADTQHRTPQKCHIIFTGEHDTGKDDMIQDRYGRRCYENAEEKNTVMTDFQPYISDLWVNRSDKQIEQCKEYRKSYNKVCISGKQYIAVCDKSSK